MYLMNETNFLINCFSLEGQPAKMEVIGSKAFQFLQKTLQPVNGLSRNSWQLKKCLTLEAQDEPQNKMFNILENEEQISSCAILPLIVKDPRSLPDKRTADVPDSGSTLFLNNEPENEVKRHIALPGISDKSDELLSSSRSKFENSTVFHDKSLWDASSGISSPIEENALCMEKHHMHMDFFCLDDPGKLKTSNQVQCTRSCPILLLRNNNSRRSIILPISWARVFWISFVSMGARAIGLKEKHWIACDIGLPYFPSDFPDCNTYPSFMATEVFLPTKRLNYILLV